MTENGPTEILLNGLLTASFAFRKSLSAKVRTTQPKKARGAPRFCGAEVDSVEFTGMVPFKSIAAALVSQPILLILGPCVGKTYRLGQMSCSSHPP